MKKKYLFIQFSELGLFFYRKSGNHDFCVAIERALTVSVFFLRNLKVEIFSKTSSFFFILSSVTLPTVCWLCFDLSNALSLTEKINQELKIYTSNLNRNCYETRLYESVSFFW